jgi:hypothetical protein
MIPSSNYKQSETMKFLSPSRFIGKSFFWAFCVMIVLLTGPRHWAASAGVSKELARELYRIAVLIPFFIHLLTGCTLDKMWVASETRNEQPVKYFWYCALSLVFGLLIALGTNPEQIG